MSTEFLTSWSTAASTSLGLFWMALWAFGLGYLISSLIQVFVTRERMRQSMGEAGVRSVLLGSFFGFVSSSCSFAALATTRSLFAKGAGLVPSLAFLLASTNLVIELGIVIAVFLGWQFVVGEYLGGVLLILFVWGLVRLWRPAELVEEARAHARGEQRGSDAESADWRTLIRSREGWRRVAKRYLMEWGMVWKDVTIGFTVAGFIASFVPRSFFEALFLGSSGADPGFLEILAQAFIGPLAAFFTFIGSMGNIPLAAVLFENGVSFAGVLAFIYSDLVVFPVLRIQVRYYGWRMAGYILALFLIALVASAVLLHYGFAAFDLLPASERVEVISERQWFAVDYTLFLNLAFLALSVVFVTWEARSSGLSFRWSDQLGERVLTCLTLVCFAWLGIGLVLPLFVTMGS